MKFFVDTADLDEITKLNDVGLVDGVTTNPSLIAKTGRDFVSTVKEICDLIDGPVSAEVTATDYDGMIKEGRKLAKIADNVTVKVPLTENGIKACKTLSDEGTMVNVTLCFSAAQAILAAKAGATFISPFVGRLDDLSLDGLQLIEDIVNIYGNYEFDTQVLVASVRSPLHIVESGKLGADVITAPPKAIWQMFKHPLTDKGLEDFLADWKKTGQSIL
ncbi:MAG: fructose-6-phosphate aldolase [Rhodospirillales bacterium]|nr:fructose-6-phosphate aldolase [Rhodospirillales bacterium]